MQINLVEVAARVKGLREMLDINTEQMAQMLEMSELDYLKKESGTEDFSVTFLSKCAAVFHVDVIELLTGVEPKLSLYSVVRKGKGLPFERRSGFSYQHLAALFKDKKMDPFLVTAPYKEEDQNKPIELSRHKGQELDYILEGQLKIQIDDKVEILEAGDSVYYNSSTGHGMIATGGKDCTFLAILYNQD